MTESLPAIAHHIDYYPLKIRVFRNGDIFDRGHVLAVTRKQFKHWIVFLDAVTDLLKTSTAVRRLFSLQGMPIQHFDELECNGEYVAVESGPFINVPYGQTRFTMRGKIYNPIIRIPDEIPTYLHSAESMDIYLKKEGYGTITGLPYPFDGILSRSPSTSQLHFKHMQSHIPPLKIGGSMEHLNELGTATWLGKNEKWMMGERVAQAPTQAPTDPNTTQDPTTAEISEDSESSLQKPVAQGLKTASSTTKLPRLITSTRSSVKRGKKESPAEGTKNLPPISNSKQKNVENEEKKSTEISKVVTSSSVHTQKLAAPNEDGVQEFQRSYQITETTFMTTPKKEKPVEKKRGKWENSPISMRKFGKSEEKSTRTGNVNMNNNDDEDSVGKSVEEEKIVKKSANDVDIDEIPRRKILTSRSVHNFFNDDLDVEIEDVLERAQRWEMNRRRQKMRQQCTQTSSSLRSISAPRRFVQIFDPDFD